MAATKKDPVIQVVTVGAVLAALYVGYKFLTGRKSTANSGGYVGGGYGGYGGYGSGYQYADANSSSPSWLSSLLKALGASRGRQSDKSGGVPSADKTAGYGGSGAGNMQTLANFVNAGNLDLQNNLDWAGGLTLADSNLLDGVGLTEQYQPMQTLDVSQYAQDYNPYSDTNANSDYSGMYTDFAAGGGGFDPSIPYDIIEGGSGIGDAADYSVE